MHRYDPSTARHPIARLRRVRDERDRTNANALPDRLVAVASGPGENILSATVNPVASGGSMGDIVERLKGLRGTCRERPVFWSVSTC